MTGAEIAARLCALVAGLELVAVAARRARDGGIGPADLEGILWAVEAALRDLQEAREGLDDVLDAAAAAGQRS
jgi:hypothetical protein